MKNILNRKYFPLLRKFATGGLFVFDFDGTLAPIVREREAARMRPRTRRLTRLLAERVPCGVMSGRSREDISERVNGIAWAFVVGNHGAEATATSKAAVQTARLEKFLQRKLFRIPGVEIENKTLSLAVHYRKARHKQRALKQIQKALTEIPRGFRIMQGKNVLDILPVGNAGKGRALVRWMKTLGRTRALYVGDDTTDEDVFKLRAPFELLKVRIGASRTSDADFYIRCQKDMDRLLTAIHSFCIPTR